MPDGQDQGGQEFGPNPGIQTGRPANSLSGFIQSMVNIHAARQNNAAADLNRMLLAADKGFPVDPKAVEKSAKKAGIPIMSPTDMKGLTEKPAENITSLQPGAGGKNAESNQPDPHAQAYNVGAITDVKERQKAETGHAVDGVIRQAVTNAQLRGHNQQQIMELTQHAMGLKEAAMNGDARAYGTLLRMGEVKPDVNAEQWDSFNPAQRQKYLDTLAGYETDAQKMARTDNIATQLMTQGSFTSPEAAMRAATIFANGGTLTPDMQREMRPTSLMDLTKEVGIAGQLADIGLPGNMIAQYARVANLGGLANVFPKGFQTLQQQTAATRAKEASAALTEAGAAALRASTDRMSMTGYDTKDDKGKITHIPGQLETQQQDAQARMLSAENVASRLSATIKTQADRDFVAQYTALVDIKRSGGKVDPDVMALMEKKLVERTGGQVTIEQVRDWENYVTFGLLSGTHPELKIGVSPEAAADTTGLTPGSPNAPDNDDPAATGAGAQQ